MLEQVHGSLDIMQPKEAHKEKAVGRVGSINNLDSAKVSDASSCGCELVLRR